jgi:hypothetical protein
MVMVPVAEMQLVCVMLIVGAGRAAGRALTVVEIAVELHPPVLLIITLYDPVTNPDLILLAWKLTPLSKL